MRQRAWDLLVVGGVAGPGPEPKQQAGAGTAGHSEVHSRRFARGSSVALAAARLGARVTLLGRTPAGPAGRAMLESLATQGVATRHVVDPIGAEPAPEGLSPDEVEALAPDRPARVLVLELEVGTPALLRAVDLAREHGHDTTVVLDAAHGAESISPELLGCTDVLKLSAAAARSLTGRAPTDTLTARRIADRFFEHGVRTVALQVQPGPGGAETFDVRPPGSQQWDPLESTCRHASLSIL